MGTLVWWLSHEAANLGVRTPPPKSLSLSATVSPVLPRNQPPTCYIVFLAGVGDFSADQLTTGESFFFDRLVQFHPNCVAVSEVFPYSVANESLSGNRLLAPVWKFANRAEGWLSVAGILIQIRNLWRFAISADERYGQIYNQGVADAVIEQMNAVYPLPQTNTKNLQVILVGTSGGVQVALGAAPYLNQWLGSKITLVSIGGVFAGDDGFDAIDHFYHLRGRQDWVEDIGGIVFPSRWLSSVGSPYNQARLHGHYTALTTGDQAHDGAKGYFGEDLIGTDGVRSVDLTLQTVNQLPIWGKSNNSSKPQAKAQN